MATSDPELEELQEMRREVDRRQRRIDRRNTEAVLTHLNDMLIGIDGLKETARLAGVSGLDSVRSTVLERIDDTKERLTVILRWQASSDPDSDVFVR